MRPALSDVDLALLCAVTPANGWIASFYLDWAAIEPHWTTIRGVLDDVAYRTRTLTTSGLRTFRACPNRVRA